MMPPTCMHAGATRLVSMLPRHAPTAGERPSCRLESRRPSEARLPAASSDDVSQHGVPDLASAPHFGASMPQQVGDGHHRDEYVALGIRVPTCHINFLRAVQKHEERVGRPAADTAELARWQRKRLETAYQAGKRSISVSVLRRHWPAVNTQCGHAERCSCCTWW